MTADTIVLACGHVVQFQNTLGEEMLRLTFDAGSVDLSKVEWEIARGMEQARVKATTGVAALSARVRRRLQNLHGDDGYSLRDPFTQIQCNGLLTAKSLTVRLPIRTSQPMMFFDRDAKHLPEMTRLRCPIAGNITIDLAPFFIPASGAAGVRPFALAMQVVRELEKPAIVSGAEYGLTPL